MRDEVGPHDPKAKRLLDVGGKQLEDASAD
jgi:hypothetical protein